ncbi:DegT/DnrJ/EryC1/StrS aminotransferase [Pseudarthrobacter chlorophenolicus A6]|uniref:DegT/DnrJ/EryC1/StrS aminotransferase n=1 Tax=Pseudarthrobacter chlorophenolicus (strain ATCC 700700 / DSM 12829 / CIP 107037 / JCM 12360 / KCTC 9906 / NCIMB 13794 / A6) TaxID=452863 RepID=B8H847_PSECP|nr:DegT/DnrJ/EryC1/StrS family aminotransferase [Pseudarthrobacter chlorophenolicus]ACL41850.1 DegT/DnrJ/EryC1/StrS aminotransferase [Pseudarthrobacter chlorophenolicus A6]SDQ57458.1 dTDP-4-amino-4,6-dideoxygalactose transaminase [Pseudarthrobacter chlorophenolicus]
MSAEAVLSRINVMKPWLGEEEARALAEVVASGWVAQGPKVKEFEEKFAAAQGVRHAVAASSCTTALHLALAVAGIGPGDDVVVPSLSFIATANAVTYLGARPVFCDVDPVTGNVTAETIHAALTLDTRAVIVVDQGGVPLDLDPIRVLCDRHEITVIEDAACAVGSTYRGRPVGAGADVAVWSFHPRKILTTGEGGMLTTNRADWAARARTLREHSMSVSAADRHGPMLAPPEFFLEVGFNYRMTDLQAAVGIVQLGRLPEVLARRREIAARYVAGLSGLRGLRLVSDPPYGTSNFQSFWIEVLPTFGTTREGLLERLAEAGISARRGIMAAHRQPAYKWRDTGNACLQQTERLNDRTLILPVFHELDDEGMNRVISTIRAAAAGADA